MTSRVQEYPALHKSFLRASLNRKLFQDQLSRGELQHVHTLIHMELWYSCLYVVTEGWKKERLSDQLVTKHIRQGAKLKLLGGCRNSVFHYTSAYNDGRMHLLYTEQGFVEWVEGLHKAFSDWFQERTI